MSIETRMTGRVAAQIASQWPYSRLNVASGSSGEETHWMPTIGHAIAAVGAILSQE